MEWVLPKLINGLGSISVRKGDRGPLPLSAGEERNEKALNLETPMHLSFAWCRFRASDYPKTLGYIWNQLWERNPIYW